MLIKHFTDKKGDAVSAKVIKAMENIDDECDEQGIIFVKIGDEKKARSYGLTELPGMVYFEDNIPNIFTGDLRYVLLKITRFGTK